MPCWSRASSARAPWSCTVSSAIRIWSWTVADCASFSCCSRAVARATAASQSLRYIASLVMRRSGEDHDPDDEPRDRDDDAGHGETAAGLHAVRVLHLVVADDREDQAE